MRQLVKLKTVNKIRSSYLRHVDKMFSVLEEIEVIAQRNRTSFLSDQNWKEIKNTYKNLPWDFQTLLLLGIIYHDIGKTIRSLDHAQLSAQMIRVFPPTVIIGKNDIVNERGWQGNLTFEEATIFLEFLVKFHEVYGNFFIGEQSLLGFEPIMLDLPKNLIEPFLDTLLVLTVAEVGSQDEHGYLCNARLERYGEGRKEVLNRKGVGTNSLRESLLQHGLNAAEVTARIFGLAYSYSTDIDKFKEKYRSTVEEAIDAVAKEIGFSKKDFVSAVARTRKLAYALRWCEKLSGELLNDGSAKPPDGLKALVRLIWIVTRPAWRAPKNTVFEIRFPPEVDPDICSKLEDKLDHSVLEAVGNIDFNWFKKNKKWEPLKSTLSVEYAGTVDKGVILLDVRMQ